MRYVPRVLQTMELCETLVKATWAYPDIVQWGSKTTTINYLKKACLETAMPSTWIHFNGGSGHMCLGSSNPLWVTLTYDIWTECKTKNLFFPLAVRLLWKTCFTHILLNAVTLWCYLEMLRICFLVCCWI